MDSAVFDKKVVLWNDYYKSLREAYLFPNEYVVRTFLGSYPKLKLPRNYRGAKICDISCGDGRNLTLLAKLGAELYATEASPEICAITQDKLSKQAEKISVDIRVGTNDSLPFDDGFFDYLLSWNACYYMASEKANFSDHVGEFARTLKSGGYLVASVPGPNCFSLNHAVELGGDLIRINNADPKFNFLNGSIYRRFNSFEDIEDTFGGHFRDFQRCTLQDDCFGLSLEYFIFVCQRR